MNENDIYTNKKGEMILSLISKYMKYSDKNVFRIDCNKGEYNIALMDGIKEMDISIQSTNSILLKFKHVNKKPVNTFYYLFNTEDDQEKITNRFLDDMDLLIGDFIKSKVDYKQLINDVNDGKLNITISGGDEQVRSNEWKNQYKKLKSNRGLEWSR